MIRTGAIWFVGLVVSLALHAVALLALAFATKPDPVQPQAVPQTRLDMATYRVDRSEATEQAAPSDAAGEAQSEPTALASAVVPTSRASGSVLPREDAAVLSTRTAPARASVPEVAALAASRLKAGAVSDLPDAGVRLAGLSPHSEAVSDLALATDTAAVVETPAAALGASIPDASSTNALGLPVEPASTKAPSSESAGEASLAGIAVEVRASVDDAEDLESAPAVGQDIAAAVLIASPAVVSAPATSRLEAQVAEVSITPALAAATKAVLAVAAPPEAIVLGAAPAGAEALIPAAMAVPSSDPAPLPTEAVREDPASDRAEASPAITPEGDRATASLAWSGAGEVDPISLAAIQAFMQPGDLALTDASVGRVKDSIASILASVPCARLQTTFRPETGALELQGHIPEEDLRGPVLAALQAQVGGAIPVADNILILPRPQCGALSGIAAVGLPQSTDQLTNPRVIGPDTHARVYAFAEGQRLTFDLEAPDYDAVIYIDYYDADGMVLHLQPNEIVELEALPAQATLTVGAARADGPSLNITVAPPFGQEIMVAMAASHPLYDGLRPIREPAEAYLQFMADRVAEARTRYPDFKGEWVYFFVKTTPR